MNQAYSESGDQPSRIRREHVNLGVAVDVAGKDGVRSLKVPSIKNAQSMNFAEFIAAYDDLIARTRENKLQVSDFEGTTISLTNPGTVGTMGSNPRLMPGQGAIIATGAIDFPPEYRGVPEDVRASMGLSKVMTVTCTYDHRVIQGAESGAFLGRIQALLEGEDRFYENVFRDLGISTLPVRWEPDQASAPLVNADPVKQAAVARLIQSWRERGHLTADLDPLGSTRPPHPDLDPSAHGLTIWDLDRTFHAGSFGVTTLRTSARYVCDRSTREPWACSTCISTIQSSAAGCSSGSRTRNRSMTRRASESSKPSSKPRDSSCSSTTASRAINGSLSKAVKRWRRCSMRFSNAAL